MGVRTALVHYTRRLKSPWSPPPAPRFCREEAAGDSSNTIDIAVGYQTEVVLARQARRERVSMDTIVTHAVFTYLADLDASYLEDSAVVSGQPSVAGDAPSVPVA